MSGNASILSQIAALEEAGKPAAIVTVVRASGSTPRKPGARMIVHPDASTEGTIGGGRVEYEAVPVAIESIRDQRPRFLELELTHQLGMCCGGRVGLFIEPIKAASRLILFGAGHVGAALSRGAAPLGFVVHVVDEREELLSPDRLPEARALHDDPGDPAIPFAPGAFVMIATHDHALDQRILEQCLSRPFRWIGLIGSRRKGELTQKRLEQKGFSADTIARVRCPVGLAIGAETPEEIAISILAELVAVRSGHSDDGRGAAKLEMASGSGRELP